MATHNDVGIAGENLAAAWLQQRGYELLHRNWRAGPYEIDIIAKKGRQLHFIEVKARQASPVGFPEDKVSRKKFRHLKRAADEFLFRNPGYQWIQYDIVSITFHRYKDPDIFLLEDVFL